MPKRESGKPTAFEKTYWILEYLKKNTDAEHKVGPKQIRYAFKAAGLEKYIGTKNTLYDFIVNLANATRLCGKRKLTTQKKVALRENSEKQ